MGIKSFIFTILVGGIILFPMFSSIKKINNTKKINLPNIIIQNAKFKIYNKKIDKKGIFSTLFFYNQNHYIIKNLINHLYEKKSTLVAKKTIFDKIWNFYDATYTTPKIKYIANKATYNDKTKILTSDKFTFFNKKIDGKGEQMVYKNDILTAKNIFYIIKDKND